MAGKIIGGFVTAIVAMFMLGSVSALIVMLLTGFLFHSGLIDFTTGFWQTYAIVMIAGILFKPNVTSAKAGD